MYYRSYGLLLLIVAVVVASQGFRDQVALGLLIAGLILCVDLPLRFLGQIVPWRSHDVVYWYVSWYRGSHIFLIPTWLVGVAALGLAAACFVSPDFSRKLTDSGKEREMRIQQANKDAKPPDPPPLPKGNLEFTIEETAPFSGTTFRYTVVNKTGVALFNVRDVVQYKAPGAVPTSKETPRRDLGPSEIRSEEIRVIGPPVDWICVNIAGTSADKKGISVEQQWNREKK